MKRKETKLEKNLQEYHYKLFYKTYEGKNSERVSGYVYQKTIGFTLYAVCLDKTREHIVSYSFSNSHYDYFNKGRIEGLQEVSEKLGEEMKKIYDFEKGVAIDLVDFSDLEEDLDNPNVSYEVDSFND